MRKFIFDNESVYHIYNRGVEKRKLFLDDKDYYRFIHNLYEFNDEQPAENIHYKDPYNPCESYETKSRKSNERKLLTEIYAFCLMPNHFHLLTRQLSEKGISNFIHKLSVGYSMYFNKKYERVGGLFQGTFKAVRLENQSHFLYIPHYIHLNPLDLIEPDWRENQIKNFNKAIDFLESYRWSSYLDYIGKKNFPSIIQKDFLSDLFVTPENFKKETSEWLKNTNLETIQFSTLE